MRDSDTVDFLYIRVSAVEIDTVIGQIKSDNKVLQAVYSLIMYTHLFNPLLLIHTSKKCLRLKFTYCKTRSHRFKLFPTY